MGISVFLVAEWGCEIAKGPAQHCWQEKNEEGLHDQALLAL